MPRLLFIAFFLILMGTGCDKEETIICYGPPIENGAQVSLHNMEVGQKSVYRIFVGEDYGQQGGEENYEYGQDTLILGVTAYDGTWYTLSEYLTEGSISYQNEESPVFGAEDTVRYRLRVADNQLEFEALAGFSNLLPLQQTGPLPLSFTNGPIVNYTGWFFDVEGLFGTTLMAYDPEFELFGINYGRANILVDNSDMAVDGPGFTLVYLPEGMLLRSIRVNPWTAEGVGFDLISN